MLLAVSLKVPLEIKEDDERIKEREKREKRSLETKGKIIRGSFASPFSIPDYRVGVYCSSPSSSSCLW